MKIIFSKDGKMENLDFFECINTMVARLSTLLMRFLMNFWWDFFLKRKSVLKSHLRINPSLWIYTANISCYF